MLWTPQKGLVHVIDNVGIVGAALGTAVPGNATTLLYGVLTECISAAGNTRDNWGISISILDTGAESAASEATLDIYIGGATDDLLIKALICGHLENRGGHMEYFFPIHIPAGLRIAAQLASVRTSITSRVIISLYSGGIPPFKIGSRVTTYGTQINNARGQAVTPTASGGAASVTQMTASSTYDHFCVMPGFQVATDTTVTTKDYNIGIGVGAATEERIGTWSYRGGVDENWSGPMPCMPAFVDIPAATRLTLLASNSGTNDAAYDGLIYAVS